MAITGTPTSGDDTITSNSQADVIIALEGDDYVFGGGQADIIYGDVSYGSNLELDSNQSPNSFSQGPLAGWFNTGSGGEIETWGDGFQGLSASDGSSFVELDVDRNGGRDHLQTNVELDEGVTYTLTFDHAARLGNGVNDDFQITLNGAVVATISPSSTDFFITSSIEITGLAGTETIGFRELNSQNNSRGVLLDNFQIALTQAEIDNSAFTFNDTLDGGAGQDTIYGQEGDDFIIGGTGADYLEGGVGADTFSFADNSNFDTIGDFTIGEDTLDVSGLTNASGDPVTVDDVTVISDGEDGSILIFPNGEQIRLHAVDPNFLQTDDDLNELGIPCFAAGTLIETPGGAVRVEDLVEGDVLVTYPNAGQPRETAGILRIFERQLGPDELDRNEKLRPIKIAAGALGKGYPERDLRVSRQHRMLLRSKIAERMIGRDEVLVPAIKLVGLPGISIDQTVTELRYFHVLMPHHEIIFAEGAPTESLFTGPEALKSLSEEARTEIFTLFPSLAAQDGAAAFRPARPIPERKQQARLVWRHAKNQKPCLSA